MAKDEDLNNITAKNHVKFHITDSFRELPPGAGIQPVNMLAGPNKNADMQAE